MSTKIIYLGVVTHDIVIFVDEMPARGGKFRAHAAEMVGGGMAANAAVAVARLGSDASFMARLDDDGIGGQIIRDLKNSNVDCELVCQSPDIRSSFSSVYIDEDGGRQMVNFGIQNYLPQQNGSPTPCLNLM